MSAMKHLNILDFQSYLRDGLWTEAFRAAVAELKAAGGGLITVPAGSYPTTSIEFCSDMTLELAEGAVLDFVNDGLRHPVVWSRFAGVDCEVYKPLIFGDHVKNVVLCGKGRLEGNGAQWWAHRLE